MTQGAAPPPVCTSFSIAPTSASPEYPAGSQLVTITGLPASCVGGDWTTSGNGSWITVSPASGSGSGSATVSWTQNTGAQRSGNATVAGNTFPVTQAAAPPPVCTSFSIAPTSASPDYAAGSQLVTITGLPASCVGGDWTTSGNGSWITVSPASGSGPGSATVSWTQNTGAQRSGNATVAGNTFPVTQGAAPPPLCTSFSIAPTSASPDYAAGSQLVTITGLPASCVGGDWTTSGNGSWITVSPASGSGPGSATVSWTQNTGAQRSGNATVAGNTFPVTQGAAPPPVCTSFSIAPTSASPDYPAGSQLVTITGLPASCVGGDWTTSGNGSWITVSPASGSGPGSATVSWTQNTGAQRSGNATVAGNTFPVTQGAAPPPVCTSFSIAPTSASPDYPAGSQLVTITGVPASCVGGDWTTSGNGSWITVSPASGSGPGSATVSWTENTGAQRSGNATVAGNTFPVDPGCGAAAYLHELLDLAHLGEPGLPGRLAAGHDHGSCPRVVSVAPGPRRATAPWITVSPASGSGPGSATVSWTENTGAQRCGNATIAGNTFAVTQGAAPPPVCTSFSIAPTSASPDYPAGSQLVTITGLPASCVGGDWTTSGNGSWITVSPASGSGSGSATVSWTQNTGAQRPATPPSPATPSP